MDNEAKTHERSAELDEGQRRMEAAAVALFQVPEVFARLHEYDDACQNTRERM